MSDDVSSQHTGEERLKLRSERLDWVDVEDDIVVLDTERSMYFAPNSSGALLWRMLVDGTTLPEMVNALATTFDITADRAEQDVDAFVERLASLGLLA